MAIATVHTVELDLAKTLGARTDQVVHVRQGEAGSVIVAASVRAGQLAASLKGLTVELVGVNARRELIEQTLSEADDGTWRCALKSDWGARCGLTAAYVRVSDGKGVVGATDAFTVAVAAGADMSEGEAAEYRRELDAIVAALKEAQEGALASKGEASGSATAAKSSADAAAEDAAAAKGSRESAEGSASAASGSAEAAKTSAGEAEASARAAAKSAAEAAMAEGSATGSASEAIKSKLAAADAAADLAELDAKYAGSEAGRVQAEAKRETAEQARAADESRRATAERTRAESEADREQAEKARASAEQRREEEAVTSATAETLAPGAAATAAKDGHTLRLGIPRGETGAQGPRGETGATPSLSLTATVDDTTGTPQVEVTRSGTDEAPGFALAFSGLKAVGAAQPMPEYDAATGRYTNDSIKAYFDSLRDGLMHLQKIPKGLPTAVETDGWFPLHRLVCGGADPDGAPWVSSMADFDPEFTEDDDGAGNNVWQAVQVVWEKWDFDSDPDYVLHYMRDMPTKGMEPNPCAYLPDGTLRPYMLTAKYPLSVDAQGRPRSVRHGKTKNRTVSHDSLVDLCACATTGYSGPSTYDVWYRYTAQFAHGAKDSQTLGAGCSSYSWQYRPALAETGVTRVVLTASQAANVLVGSNVSLGKPSDGHTDRNYADTYDVFDMRRVTSKEELDDGSVAVSVDGEPFDTSEAQLLSSMPWDGGYAREGDRTGKWPMLLEGVELMHGGYEVMGTVLYWSEGDGWYAAVNPDSRNEKKNALADGAIKTSLRHTADSKWPLTVGFEAGLVAPVGEGGSSTTGMGDVNYNSADTATGVREDLHFGSLGSGSGAGVSFRGGWNWPGAALWLIVSRLSATGRSLGVKAA